jgi:long-chain fatty acid transport protein
MTLATRGHVLRAFVALPLLCSAVPAHASGFATEGQGARALGLAGACVAQTEDPSAISWNAAGIAFLRDHHLYLSGSLATQSTGFTGAGPYPPAGTVESSQQGVGPLPAVYYSQEVGERAVLGIGFSRPFAASNDWQQATRPTGRFTCFTCDFGAWSVNPTVAFKLADRFAIGGGLDVRLSSFNLTRRVVADPNPFTQLTDVAEIALAGSTRAALGWNLGLVARPSEAITLGLAYRHEVVVDHDVTASFTQIPTGNATVDAAVAASLPDPEAAAVGLVYPASLAAGIAWRGERIRVEADVVRTLWSSFDNVPLTYRSTSYDQLLPQDFASAWTLALGAEYDLGETWQFRGGYSFDQSPQPVSTLSPFMVDAGRHGFSVGGGRKLTRLRLDAAVRLVLRGSRATDGQNRYGYEGVYDPSASLGFALALGYRF